jgi:hypothetical protein
MGGAVEYGYPKFHSSTVCGKYCMTEELEGLHRPVKELKQDSIQGDAVTFAQLLA